MPPQKLTHAGLPADRDDYTEYLGDLDLLWRQAEQQNDLALALRCALIAASIRSLSARITPELLTGLLCVGTPAGRWSAQTALAHIRLISDEAQQMAALEALLACDSELPLDQLLKLARAMPNLALRVRLLAALVEHMPIEQQVAICDEAIAIIWACDDSSVCEAALLGLIHHLPAALLPRIWAAPARKCASRQPWIDPRWAALLQNLSLPDEIQQQLYAVARSISAAWPWAASSGRRATHLFAVRFGHTFSRMLAAARDISEEWRRSAEASGLAQLVPTELIEQALSTIRFKRDIPDGHPWHIYTLASLALLLPATRQAEVLAEAGADLLELLRAYRAATDDELIHPYELCTMAIKLAPLLPPACLTELSTLAQAIDHELMHACLLDGLAMRMPGMQEEARAAAHAIPNDTLRIDMLAKLAAHLPAEQQADAYAAILASARKIDDGNTVAAALVALAEQLPADLQLQAVVIARALPSAMARAYALMRLAATMPTSERAALYAEATESLFAISDANERADAIAEFAACLPAERLPAALDSARAVGKWHRRHALAALIPQLPLEQRPAVCEEALALARHRHGYNDIWLLMEIAPHLPYDQRLDAYRQAIQAACDDTDKQSLDDLLPELIAQLPGELLEEAFAAFHALPEGWERAYTLARMAPQIPAERIWDMLPHNPELLHNLERLIPWLPDARLPEVRACLGSIESPWDRARAIAVLAPRLAADQQASIYADMLQAVSVSPWNRSEAIVQLAPGLPADLLERAYELADSLDTPAERAQALAALLPRLPAERAAILAAEVLRSLPADSDHYDYILRNMVPNLPNQLLAQALVLSCHIPNIWWPEVAALMAPRLASYDRDHTTDVLPYVYTALRALAAHGRERLLRDLAALAPVLAALAPAQALGEVVTTIGDVARRWP